MLLVLTPLVGVRVGVGVRVRVRVRVRVSGNKLGSTDALFERLIWVPADKDIPNKPEGAHISDVCDSHACCLREQRLRVWGQTVFRRE